MWLPIFAIFFGAGFGALLRAAFNFLAVGLASSLPLGTFISNMVGGYLIGIAVAFFGNNPDLSPEWKLLVVTGFLGGLTTFSSFSGEAMTLLTKGQYAWAGTHIALHVLGSLAMTGLGLLTVHMLRS